jgi:hypothetical protein
MAQIDDIHNELNRTVLNVYGRATDLSQADSKAANVKSAASEADNLEWNAPGIC